MTRLLPPLERCCAVLTGSRSQTRSRHRRRWGAALLAAGFLSIGCPVPRVPAESGPESLRDVRGRLEGEWVLARFERRSDTEPWVMVPSRGRLTYDRFGHLSSRGELTDGVPLTSLVVTLLDEEGRAEARATWRRVDRQPRADTP